MTKQTIIGGCVYESRHEPRCMPSGYQESLCAGCVAEHDLHGLCRDLITAGQEQHKVGLPCRGVIWIKQGAVQ